VLKNGPPQRLLHVYGPQRANIHFLYLVSDVLEGLQPFPSVARSTHRSMLDAQMQPVPIGVPGELYIGGAGLEATSTVQV